MKTEKQMAMAAAEFAERWKGREYERGESQPIKISKLLNVDINELIRPDEVQLNVEDK